MSKPERIRPGQWGEVPERPRRDRGLPIGAIVPPAPVKAHTPFGRSVCNSFCSCKKAVGLVGSALGSIWIEPVPSPDGAFVLEMDEHRKPVAVAYDAAIHAGWLRYAEHVCAAKEAPR